MPEVRLWRPKGEQFTDDAGQVLAGGYLEYDQANSDTDLTVYTDKDGANGISNGAPALVLDAYGRLSTAIYIPVGQDFKETLKNSSGATIFSDAEIQEVEASTEQTTAVLHQAVISKSSAYSIQAADKGKLVNVNPTNGSFIVTLLTPSIAGNGFRLTVRHSGTANRVVLKQGSNLVALLMYPGQIIDVYCNGASYTASPMILPGRVLSVENNTLVDPPVSPSIGDMHIIAPSGTPVNDWASFSNNDIVWTDGTNWARHTPNAGDKGLVALLDSGILLEWMGSAWGIIGADSNGVPDIIIEDKKSNGTAGQGLSTGSWQKRDLTDKPRDLYSVCTLSSSQITLTTGIYYFEWSAPGHGVGFHNTVLYNVTDDNAVQYGTSARAQNSSDQSRSSGQAVVNIDDTKVFELRHRVGIANPSDGGGAPCSFGVDERYTVVKIHSMRRETL